MKKEDELEIVRKFNSNIYYKNLPETRKELILCIEETLSNKEKTADWLEDGWSFLLINDEEDINVEIFKLFLFNLTVEHIIIIECWLNDYDISHIECIFIHDAEYLDTLNSLYSIKSRCT